MKRKIEFMSYLDNELIAHFRDYGDVEVKDFKIHIRIKDYEFIVSKNDAYVTYNTPLKNTFHFDASTNTICEYETPYGIIKFGVVTNKFKFENNLLEIEYNLVQGNENQGNYKILLQYK